MNEERELKPIRLVSGMTAYVTRYHSHYWKSEETLVYLEMIGPKQIVRSNWARMVGNQAFWFEGNKHQLKGMKDHRKVESVLPCGWLHFAMIHKQASLEDVEKDGDKFYVLGPENGPLFFTMLDKCQSTPMLPEWSDYLWQEGRHHGLIHSMRFGAEAWWVYNRSRGWQEVISHGLQRGHISLRS